jgi:hypothetical protein
VTKRQPPLLPRLDQQMRPLGQPQELHGPLATDGAHGTHQLRVELGSRERRQPEHFRRTLGKRTEAITDQALHPPRARTLRIVFGPVQQFGDQQGVAAA